RRHTRSDRDWSSDVCSSDLVNGVTSVPTKDGKEHLIPLPQRADPNAITVVQLKLASRSGNRERVSVAAPVVGAPVLLANWKLEQIGRASCRERVEEREAEEQ